MTIHLSKDVENSIIAAVQSGEFASADEMVSKLVREYSQRLRQQPTHANNADATPDPLMGLWQDYAEEMDEIVADAMKRRKEEPWRVIAGE
jgi:Arc/MetJ-type ribon-helix-helix transcriptional regulator